MSNFSRGQFTGGSTHRGHANLGPRLTLGGFALAMLWLGVSAIPYTLQGLRSGDRSQVWLGLAGAITGLGMSAAFVWLYQRYFRGEARLAKWKARWPGEPWRWREDWSAGVARPQWGKAGMAWLAIALMVSFGAVAVWLVFGSPGSAPPTSGQWGVLGLLTVVVLIGFGYAGWLSAKWFRWRASAFEFKNSNDIAGTLQGSIRLSRPVQSRVGWRLRLTCFDRRLVDQGRDTRQVENLLWQEEAKVSPAQVSLNPQAALVPVSFMGIPRKLSGTTAFNGETGIFWRLELAKEASLLDYFLAFEVPVFPGLRSEVSVEANADRFDHARTQAVPSPISVPVVRRG